MTYHIWETKKVADRAYHVLYGGRIDDMEVAQNLTVVLVDKSSKFWADHPIEELSMEDLHQLVLDSRTTGRGQKAWEEARYAHRRSH